MFKELLRLWWIQTRRDFSWKKVAVAAYLLICFLAVVIGVYFGMKSEGEIHIEDAHIERLSVLFAFIIILPDLILKIWWRNDPVEPDDYLKTRPISQSAWSKFVLFSTATTFTIWMIPLLYTMVNFLLMPITDALMTFVVMLSVSFANALTQNCWKRANQASEYATIIIGYILWLAFGSIWMIASFIGFAFPAYAWTFGVVYLLLNICFCCCLQYAFGLMRNYYQGKKHASKVHSWGETSLFSIEYVSILRCKRLRTSVIFIAIIFLMNVYIQFGMQETMDTFNANMMLLFAIAFPAVILGQWVLGVEANYFHGIWSKPYPVEIILRNKYYFFCLLCVIMTLLSLPAAIWLYLSIWQLLATLIFSMGVFVLLMMPTCLFSSRMDLFSSAFFNYQGGNKKLNIYSFVILIPAAMYLCAYSFLPTWVAHGVVAGAGVLGFALHQIFLKYITSMWQKRRYAIMERWMKE